MLPKSVSIVVASFLYCLNVYLYMNILVACLVRIYFCSPVLWMLMLLFRSYLTKNCNIVAAAPCCRCLGGKAYQLLFFLSISWCHFLHFFVLTEYQSWWKSISSQHAYYLDYEVSFLKMWFTEGVTMFTEQCCHSFCTCRIEGLILFQYLWKSLFLGKLSAIGFRLQWNKQ